MTNKRLITDNPYRRLGIYVGDPVKVEVRNLNRITAFSRVGQTATFDMRCDDLLAVPAVRTEESAKEAANALALPRERLRHALMWLGDEDTEWGRTLSGAVTALIREDYTTAIRHYDILTSRDDLREEMIKAATHGLLALTKSEMIEMVADVITEYSDDLHTFWRDGNTKPSCLLTQLLWQRKDDRISRFLDGLLSFSVTVSEIYEGIDRFNRYLDKLALWSKSCRDIWGEGSIQYQIFATDVAKGVYSAATVIIRTLGKLAWHQNVEYKNGLHYRRHVSGPAAAFVRGCMELMKRVMMTTEGFLASLMLNESSVLMLEGERREYDYAISDEYINLAPCHEDKEEPEPEKPRIVVSTVDGDTYYVMDRDNEDKIRRSVRRYRIQKAMELTVWAAVVALIFISVVS